MSVAAFASVNPKFVALLTKATPVPSGSTTPVVEARFAVVVGGVTWLTRATASAPRS